MRWLLVANMSLTILSVSIKVEKKGRMEIIKKSDKNDGRNSKISGVILYWLSSGSTGT